MSTLLSRTRTHRRNEHCGEVSAAEGYAAVPSPGRRGISPSRLAAALAISVASLVVLGGFGVLTHVASASEGAGAKSSLPEVPATPRSIEPSAAPAAGTTASCGAGQHTSAGSLAQASPAPGSSSPPTLYNSQVEPYATLTGNYSYVAKGAALRDQGYGEIDLTWPGGLTKLVAAYMIWSMLDNSTPAANGTLNKVNVTGTWAAYATPSPCWAPTYIYAFVADVTADVVNGVNVLTGFPSGVTNGGDPWAEPQVDPMDEGVSLIAIYQTGSSLLHQVTVYVGAETTEGDQLNENLNYTTTNSTAATTTYVIADGQLPGNAAIWNGSIIDPNAFHGSDPHESTTAWSYGNLSDTKTYSVTVPNGSSNITAAISPEGSGDCFTWVGQVLSVGVAAPPPPYPVKFTEEGLANGTAWHVTTNDTEESGTVADLTSTISFALPNGTYTYTVTPVPGFTAVLKGSYSVDGGPVLLRVLFHQTLYPLVFSSTGLPDTDSWEVEVTNVSQKISGELSTSPPGTLDFAYGNGTYDYTVTTTSLYTPDPSSGQVTLDDAGASVVITFVPPPLYNVTFVEHGLPAGRAWGGAVDTNWGSYDNSTDTTSFVLQLPNTTSDDSMYPDYEAGFAPPSWIYFTVAGAPKTVDVNYTLEFDVNLTETGLPSDTDWYATLSGGSIGTLYAGATSAPITFAAPNGTYTFTVDPVWGYRAVPATGSVTVDDSNVTVSIVF